MFSGVTTSIVASSCPVLLAIRGRPVCCVVALSMVRPIPRLSIVFQSGQAGKVAPLSGGATPRVLLGNSNNRRMLP